MKPENRHVVLNVRPPQGQIPVLIIQLDCKIQNNPHNMFPLMAKTIQYVTVSSSALTSRKYPDWETLLAPRLILGLWHPLFVEAAYQYLPLLTRYHIGLTIPVAKRYFWDHVEGKCLLTSSTLAE